MQGNYNTKANLINLMCSLILNHKTLARQERTRWFPISSNWSIRYFLVNEL